MAKFAGKIFKVSNNKIGIRNDGAHNVHVVWYNPFKRKFRCKVITSLESEKELNGKELKQLKTTPYVKKRGAKNTFRLFKRNKYAKVRKGEIVPIPESKLQGFAVWSGYQNTVELSLDDLKKAKAQNDKKILKQRKAEVKTSAF